MSTSLLSQSDIFAASVSLGRGIFCGVYFLLMDEDVVYVGGSNTLLSRLATHIRKRAMKFNRIAFVKCDRRDVWTTEKAYIKAFDPIYNRRSGAPDGRSVLSVPRGRPAYVDDGHEFMTREEVAGYLSLRGIFTTSENLAGMAHRGTGPQHYRITQSRDVLYKRAEVEGWLAAKYPACVRDSAQQPLLSGKGS